MTAVVTEAATLLVVDDEALCRVAVAEILKSRGGFRTVCAANAAEALTALERGPIDLILLDVRMPNVDGLALLRMLRADRRYDQLPVVLLTDSADEAVVREAASLRASGYLLKAGFSSDVLLERVRQVLKPADGETRAGDRSAGVATASASAPPPNAAAVGAKRAQAGTLDPAHVREALQRRIELQPVSPTLSEVMRLTLSSSTSVRDLADVVRKDGALALRILRVANSSLYSTGGRAKTLADAAARLGVAGIRNAVATAAAADEFAQRGSGGLVPQRTWEHSLAVAMIAHAVALRLRPEVADDVYLAGLLHDVGRLVLHAAVPEEFERAMAAARADEIADLNAYEQRVFGVSHADVTRLTLRPRGLPEIVVEAAAMHEQPLDVLRRPSPFGTVALIIALADRVAHALALGDSGAPTLLPLKGHAAALGLDAAVVEEIGREAARCISDSELSYGCFCHSEFLPPLAQELGASLRDRPAIGVVGRAVAHPVVLLLDAIGWRAESAPDVLVVLEGTDAAAARARLDSERARRGRAIGCLMLGDAGERLAEAIGADPCACATLPVRYAALIRAIEALCGAAPRRDST